MKSRRKGINKRNNRASVSCGTAASSLLIGVPGGWGRGRTEAREQKNMYILEKTAKILFQFDEHYKHTDPSISTNPKQKKHPENHINAYLLQLLKASDKEEKKTIIIEQQRMTVGLSETMQARRHRRTALKVLI